MILNGCNSRITANIFLNFMAFMMVVILLVGRWGGAQLFFTDTSPLSITTYIGQVRSWAFLGLFMSIVCLLLIHKCVNVKILSFPYKTLALLIFYIVIILLLSSGIWSYSDELFLVPTIVDLLFMLCFLILSTFAFSIDRMHRLFWRYVLYVGIPIILYGMISVLTADNVRQFSILGGGAIIFARIVGTFLIVTLFLIVGKMRSNIGSTAMLVTLLLSSILLIILSGSRGGLLSTSLAVTVIVIRTDLVKWKIFLALPLIGLGVFFASQFTNILKLVNHIFSYRILELTVKQKYSSERDSIFSKALEIGLENPILGIGLNSFRNLTPEGHYPHNLFLEIFTNVGIGGALLMLIGLLIVFVTIMQSRKETKSYNYTTLYASALCLHLVSSQFSGDIYDSRGVFFFSVAILMASTTDYPSQGEHKHLISTKA